MEYFIKLIPKHHDLIPPCEHDTFIYSSIYISNILSHHDMYKYKVQNNSKHCEFLSTAHNIASWTFK